MGLGAPRMGRRVVACQDLFVDPSTGPPSTNVPTRVRHVFRQLPLQVIFSRPAPE